MKSITPGVLLIVGAFALAGCGDGNGRSTSSPTIAPTPTVASLTYTDPTYGYSFEYPASWFLNEQSPSPSHQVDLTSYNPDTTAGGRIQLDQLKASFWVAERVDKPILEWLADGRNQPGQPPAPTDITHADTTLDGLPGILEVVQMSDGEDSALHKSYYIPIGLSRIFVIKAVPADSKHWPEFEAVLTSVRLPDLPN